MDFSLTLDGISKQFTDVKKLFTSAGPGLPVADLEMVIDADAAYAQVASTPASTPEDYAAHDAARFRLAWALAHSKKEGNGKRAVALLQEGAYDWADAVGARDRRYITAVAHYNDGDFLAARDAAEQALTHDAMCRQAETLCAAAENAIARDGLIGIGAVGVGAAVLGGIVTALATTRRR